MQNRWLKLEEGIRVLLTAEEVFVILFDMEDDCAGQLHLGEEVEVAQNEENLALRLELRNHKLLIRKQVVILLLLVGLVLVCSVLVSVVQDLVLAVLAIS